MDLPALLGYPGSFARGALHHSLREGEKFRKWMSWMFRMLVDFSFFGGAQKNTKSTPTTKSVFVSTPFLWLPTIREKIRNPPPT